MIIILLCHKTKFSSFWVIIGFLNLKKDFAFLIYELKIYSIGHSIEKNVLLKLFILDDIHFNLSDDTDLKG